MLPRKRPGRTCLGWRDETFGSLNKDGREIESDTWQGPLPGQHAEEAGPYSAKTLPGQALAGGLGRGQKWVRRGTAEGRRGGVRTPVGNGKA